MMPMPDGPPPEGGGVGPGRRSSISPFKLVGIGCLVCLLLGLGCAGLFGALIWKGTSDARPGAEAFLGRLQGNDAAEAWKESHPEFQRDHSPELLASVMERVGEVMGPLGGWNLQGTYVEDTSAGKMVSLTYGGTFANGAGTITVVMKDSGEGYRMHSFNVASPLFDAMTKCPRCAYPCSPGTRFCPKCGASVESGESSPPPGGE